MALRKSTLIISPTKVRKQADRSMVKTVKVHADKLGFKRKPKHVKKEQF